MPSNTAALSPAPATPPFANEDATMPAPMPQVSDLSTTRECCLVQIYPADVVDGMLLLEDDRLTIGRDDDCDLFLHDSSVSRRHAELRRCVGGYELVDLDSTNGSRVNGEAIAIRRLSSGDTLQIGCYMFKFLSAGSVESQYHETVYQTMTRDALTGAVNKRYLLESLGREIARSARQHSPLAVLMLDIDHFKSVNDTHGHLVGDEVLREFGKRIDAVCREDDLLARYGGEEFCLVLFATERDEALEMAERFRRCVTDTPFDTAAGPLPISASFGVAMLNTDPLQTPLEVIHVADQRLYEAKHGGRNRVCG